MTQGTVTPNIEKLQALYDELAAALEGKYMRRRRRQHVQAAINAAFKAETNRDYDPANLEDMREMATLLATTYEGPPSRELVDQVMEIGMAARRSPGR